MKQFTQYRALSDTTDIALVHTPHPNSTTHYHYHVVIVNEIEDKITSVLYQGDDLELASNLFILYQPED